MYIPTARTAHTTAFDGPVVIHWLERKIAQTENASAMPDRSAMLRPAPENMGSEWQVNE